MLGVIANGKIDPGSKKKLVSLASELMEMSQKLNTSPSLDRGLIARVVGVLAQVVRFLIGLRHGH